MYGLPVFCIFLVNFSMPMMLPPPDPTTCARNCVVLLYRSLTGPITLHNSVMPSTSLYTILPFCIPVYATLLYHHSALQYPINSILLWLYPNHTLLPYSKFLFDILSWPTLVYTLLMRWVYLTLYCSTPCYVSLPHSLTWLYNTTLL